MSVQIAFVDTRLADWQLLVAGLDPGVEVFLLDPLRDGMLQIAEALEGRSGVNAIHILSHGAEGGLVLGSTALSEDNLGDYASALATIGQALTETGDILLYGCDIGSGDSGQSFITALARYTSADIAASTDATGSNGLGGDWVLEAATGSIEVQPLSGEQTAFDGLLTNAPPALAFGALDPAFDDDGMLPVSFNSSGAEPANMATRMVLQADGRIVVAATTESGRAFGLTRFNSDGSLDTAFDHAFSSGRDEQLYSVALQGDGKIVAEGFQRYSSGLYSFALARYNANGTLDSAFDGDGTLTMDIGAGDADASTSMVLQADGRIVVAAGAMDLGGGGSRGLVLGRFNANGNLDNTFDGDGLLTTQIDGPGGMVVSMALQADGKIVVAGSSAGDFLLLRYNSDGSLDTMFDGDGMLTTSIGAFDDQARSLVVQPDGKILVAGRSWNGLNYDFALARYNANGSPDTTFDGDGKLTTAVGTSDDAANSVALQADGKIVVAGLDSGGGANWALARYNSDGSLDNRFDGDGTLSIALAGGANGVQSLLVQPDCAIVAAGYRPDAGVDHLLIRLVSIGIPDRVTTEGAVFSFAFDADLFSDPEGGALTYTTSALPAWLSFDAATRTFSGAPDSASAGTFDVTVTATDPGLVSASDSFVITVQNNDPPVAVAPGIVDQAATEDAGFSFTIAATAFTDPEGGALTYATSALPGWLSFADDTRTFSGMPSNADVGFVDVQIIATDIWNAQGADTFRITVANTNDPPVLQNPVSNKTAQAGTLFSFTIPSGTLSDDTFVDVDVGDVLTYKATLAGGFALPNWLEFETRTFSVTAPLSEVGNGYTILLSATDQNSSSAYWTFFLWVTSAAGGGINVIPGDALNNVLTGTSGADSIDGGAGVDIMTGGFGDDIYVVDDSADDVVEFNRAAEGNDVVQSAANFTLPDSVENLILTGASAINGTGNNLPNQITGNSGNNRLDGGQGIDLLVGGDGDDTYVVDNASDLIVEDLNLGIGADTVEASVSYDISLASGQSSPNLEDITLTGTGDFVATGNAQGNVIAGNPGNNYLSGGAGNDTIYGLAGNDTLDGGAGADAMEGGTGDDTYVVDNLDDTVLEVPNEVIVYPYQGNDTVKASVTWTLGPDLENLILTVTGNINGTGNELYNTITGNSGNNQLTGLGGNDTFFGGGGADTLIGGTGNDIYHIDSADNPATVGVNEADVVIEASGEGEVDQVVIAVNFANDGSPVFELFANVERVTVVDTNALVLVVGNDLDNLFQGGDRDDYLNGALGKDTLNGAGGDDTLDGGRGVDSMVGGAGNDLFYVDNLADVVVETANGQGLGLLGEGGPLQGLTDTIVAAIDYSLASVANVENLTLSNEPTASETGTLPTSGTGSDGDNVLTGNSVANTLTGAGGNDTLIGGSGNDSLDGSSGTDTAAFSGTMAQYRLLSYAGASYVADLVASRDGMDRLVSIEGLRFADASSVAPSAVQAFAPLAYIASHADLIGAFGTDADAGIAHYVNWGSVEGRQISFNGLAYIASYADLGNAFGANADAGASHYISYGRNEGRTSTFDGLAYIASYADLINAFGANADAGASHYINYGRNEGRTTSSNGLA